MFFLFVVTFFPRSLKLCCAYISKKTMMSSTEVLRTLRTDCLRGVGVHALGNELHTPLGMPVEAEKLDFLIQSKSFPELIRRVIMSCTFSVFEIWVLMCSGVSMVSFRPEKANNQVVECELEGERLVYCASREKMFNFMRKWHVLMPQTEQDRAFMQKKMTIVCAMIFKMTPFQGIQSNPAELAIWFREACYKHLRAPRKSQAGQMCAYLFSRWMMLLIGYESTFVGSTLEFDDLFVQWTTIALKTKENTDLLMKRLCQGYRQAQKLLLLVLTLCDQLTQK